MGCRFGCDDRKEIALKAADAARKGDLDEVKRQVSAMAQSLAADATKLRTLAAVRLKRR
jgi:hypothetical protein